MWMFPVGWIPEKSVFFATVPARKQDAGAVATGVEILVAAAPHLS
jgi:hypothetical protein